MLHKRKFVYCGRLITNGAFFSALLEYYRSQFRDRQISQVETGALPDFKNKIWRLVTLLELLQRNRLSRPSRNNCLKEKQNKQSCFFPCKRIGENLSKVNDQYPGIR